MFSSWTSLILSTLTGLLGLAYLWAKWKHTYWQRRGVPTLPANLIFGNFRDSVLMKIAPGYLLGRLYREADEKWPFVGIYIMHKPFLLLRSPELMKQIFIKDFEVFSHRHFASPRDSSDRVSSDGLFSIQNPEWRYLRSKLSPAFSSGKLKGLFNLMVESADSLKNHLADSFKDCDSDVSANGKTLELKDASTKFTTDVISSLAFGVRTNSFEQPPPEFYVRSRGPAFSMSLFDGLVMFTVAFFPGISRYLGGSMLGKNTDYFRQIFWSAMRSRDNGKHERGDVIDSLHKLENEKSDNGFVIEGDVLVAQSAIFFVAGLETSSVTMSFALFELAKQPNLQTRVREEIMEAIGENGKLTYESVQNMKYLMAVINETLRLYPPAPMIDRVATSDYKIPGTDVILEKGTVVYAALPGLHMDPKYFDEPEIFDPDRFSDERKQDIKPHTFMPFGEGPRACIGMRVGLYQTAVGLITILRDYEVSVNPKYKTEVSPRSPFTTPANGIIMLTVRKISSS